MRRSDDELRCGFCGNNQKQVKKLIAGPSVYICNGCIEICNEIIVDDRKAEDHKNTLEAQRWNSSKNPV
jgi:ATP-dependent protease Clp ATPase subunit